MLLIKTRAPLQHLLGESVSLPVNAVPTCGVLQHAGNDRPQLDLNVRKRSATLALVVHVLAHRLAENGERDEGPISGAPKSAIQLFRQGGECCIERS